MSDRRLFRAAYMMHPYWIGSPIKPGEWINTTDKVLWWMHNLDADTDMGDTPLDDLEKYLCLEEILPGSTEWEMVTERYGWRDV
ncbi:hypothetical protein [Mycobacteroides chelonae]|uniref:hypothetical protein n=1 Tax=Mycobacteroides chelonae TaxID=1774 RepID=UPI0008A89A4F|nr:hypothetical protein [Mycobacteroides chelonae]OHT47899.1 hypothetical protein BKG63_24020 [Mycobacteroides chelonae]OHT99544.1 hypothetical protein BKG72_03690 [Mycobacteroides chelonae]OLT92923.1 hypothetical protein BKG59_05690 [Mycobacteroides chelonae]